MSSSVSSSAVSQADQAQLHRHHMNISQSIANDYGTRWPNQVNKPPNYQETCRKSSTSSQANNATIVPPTFAQLASPKSPKSSLCSQTSPRVTSNVQESFKKSINNNTFTKDIQEIATLSPVALTDSANMQTSAQVKPMKTQLTSHHSKQPKLHKYKGKHHHSTHHAYYPNGNHPHLNPDRLIAAEEANGQQRTLVNLFQLYVVIVIILALVYAIYQFAIKQQQHQLNLKTGAGNGAPIDPLIGSESSANSIKQYLTSGEGQDRQLLEHLVESSSAKQSELEQKVQLMQKYIELIAADLHDTKERLREREKCHCSRSCQHNMTQYADGASWQHQCDTCSCQSGKVTCTAVKCPQPTCDDAKYVPGQCCPVCLKKCKHNQMSLKHGQTFRPNESPAKECTCFDGLIKCAPTKTAFATSASNSNVNNISSSQTQGYKQLNKQQAATISAPNKRTATGSSETSPSLGDRFKVAAGERVGREARQMN